MYCSHKLSFHGIQGHAIVTRIMLRMTDCNKYLRKNHELLLRIFLLKIQAGFSQTTVLTFRITGQANITAMQD